MVTRSCRSWRSPLPLAALFVLVGCGGEVDSESAPAVSQTPVVTDGAVQTGDFEFAAPIQLATEEGHVRVEAPGYAAPCWADIDGDGTKDLLVGQFNGGKIKVHKHLGNLKFGKSEWLQAEGSVAQVPGVW